MELDGTYTLEGGDLMLDFDSEGDDDSSGGEDNRGNDNFLGEFATDVTDWTYNEGEGVIRNSVSGDGDVTVVLERQ